MPNIVRYLPLLNHISADANEYLLLYKNGKIKRKGVGLSFWFRPLNSALVKIPAEDRETSFTLNERTADFQDVMIQCSVTFRIHDPELAAQRVNFTISSSTGAWTDRPTERLASIISQRAKDPVRETILSMNLEVAASKGAAELQRQLITSVQNDSVLQEMGVSVISLQIVAISPQPEMERALQTPARESIQQKADEATFQRRALAVEKERAIKENELSTEIELARRQEDLIKQEGANRMREVEQAANMEMAQAEAKSQRERIEANTYSETVKTRASGDTEAMSMKLNVQLESELKRIEAYSKAPAHVSLGNALHEAARQVRTVKNLNITPELLSTFLDEFLTKNQD